VQEEARVARSSATELSRVVRLACAFLTASRLRSSNCLIVVQRTHRAVLQGILQNPDRWPTRSAVMVDRRHRERRLRMQQVTIERRRSQRRAEPHAMWYTHGFMVIETPGLPTEAIALNTQPA
jgi:hypothetical protein